MTATYERKIYALFDVLGDYGGVELVLNTVAEFIVGPFALHNYIILAISTLYRARSKDESIFHSESPI